MNTILLSSARSGTNFFLSTYRALLPEDLVLAEIFRRAGDSLNELSELLEATPEEVVRLASEEPLRMWRRIEESIAAGGRSVIAKVFYYHATGHNDLWQHFRDENRIVHLIRRNPFDAFVSRQLAHATGDWRGRQQEDGETQFEIGIGRLTFYIELQKVYVAKVRKSYSASPHYTEVFYEDICDSTRSCAQVVGDLYGVDLPEEDIAIGLRKQNRTPHRDRILNYSAVRHLDRPAF